MRSVARQIQVESLVAEMNLLRSQPDVKVIAQRAIDETLLEVNQSRRLLSAVRLSKEQESELRSHELDVENLIVLSAEPDPVSGERTLSIAQPELALLPRSVTARPNGALTTLTTPFSGRFSFVAPSPTVASHDL
eukprot:SAG11_NODE_6029_length_1406_cov_1.275440_1_plen_135_part_00